MNQDDDLYFSEVRRKRQGVRTEPPSQPAAGGPQEFPGYSQSHMGPMPGRPGMPYPPNPGSAHRPVPPAGGGQGFSVQDAYFLFFRHKWTIIVMFLLSLVAAGGFYYSKSVLYESEAKILVRYILESPTTPTAMGDSGSPVVKAVDERGDNIMNSEIQILTSADLAKKVAEKVGPEKILGKPEGEQANEQDLLNAAAVINGGLSVDAPMRGSVLRLVFRHQDPKVVQPVLRTLIETYLTRSVEIHLGVGAMDDFFMRQADQLRTRLAQTESDLKKLKDDANIISLEDSKQTYLQVMSRIQNDLLSAETDLAARLAALEVLRQVAPTNGPVATNEVAVTVPPEAYEQFRKATGDLQALRAQLGELRNRYTDEHFLVRNVNTQIATAEAERARLTQEYPSLANMPTPTLTGTNQLASLNSELLQANALQARIEALKSQLDKVRASAGRMADLEPAIAQLERNRAADEKNYLYYKTKLEHAQMDESLGAGSIPNIIPLQDPTTPARIGKKASKPMLMIILFGCCAGFAWGFISDRILNPTINQVADLERHLHVPLFISVPDMTRRGQRAMRRMFKRKRGSPAMPTEEPEPAGAEPAVEGDGEKTVGPWDPAHVMRPYYEGLRDRLITYFEVRNMNYKPKMVAITGCKHGAGVTTMAAGLAAALSETGDGKVLLVDMNLERGAAHPFFQGKPAGALTDALGKETREPAMVNDNLYVVSAHEPEFQPKNQQLPSVLPKRFTGLVPKMKASDYDYIIFDMPPVTQTSFTARLAGFMDMVLLVVESEKTGQGILKRTHGLLNESRPNMAVILNKHHSYVPPNLAQEL